MRIDAKHEKFATHYLIDERNHIIPMVRSYDDETGELEVYLRDIRHNGLFDDGTLIIANTILRKARLVPKKDYKKLRKS